MKVLMISGDPAVLDKESAAGKKMQEYREVFDELSILLCRKNIFSFISGFFRGLKMMRKGYNIITAQDMEHSFFAWMFSKIYGVPWQMQIHTDIFSPYFVKHSVLNKIRLLLVKFLLPRADCVRVVSERIKKSIIDYNKYVSSCVAILPIFVDTEKFRNAPVKIDLHEKYGKDKFIILMASRITKEKNIGLAIEAFGQILKTDSKIREEGKAPLLLIVGDGPEKKNLQNIVSDLKLGDNIIFEAATSDLASYYKTCDLFLLTSNYEGYGMTLVEAAASGAKIISSDVGIAPEILEPENIFKVSDKDDLKTKLTAALQGKLSLPKPVVTQTKEEYLMLYKSSLEICLRK